MKTCNRCKEEKELDCFSKMTKAKDGRQYTCKACHKLLEVGRRDYHKNKMRRMRADPEYRINEAANKRDYRLQWAYGITEQEFVEILESQNYCCRICEKHEIDNSKNLSVDHNHDTGKVRGLLCDACNRGLGMLKDSPLILQKALDYLKDEGHYGRS